MKTFLFRFYIRTNGQEFNVGSKTITAKDYDSAVKTLNKLDLPFHHFATVN